MFYIISVIAANYVDGHKADRYNYASNNKNNNSILAKGKKMKKPNYLEVTVKCVAEAVALLLELRRQFFFSFRGQRDHRWDIGPHDIPKDWEDWKHWQEIHKRDLVSSKEDTKYLSELGTEEKDIFLKSKCVRQYIAENLSQFLRHIQYLDGPLSHGKRSDWWNDLIVAHHYGFKSLLLDWTSNPLVALYFAVENVLSRSDDKIRGAVFALKVADHTHPLPAGKRWYDFQEVQDQFLKGEGCNKWIMINPPFNSDRIIRQSGKFSYHPSIIDRNLVYFTNKTATCLLGQDEALVKIVIGNDTINPTADIRKELGIMNIHHGSLFPDYDGFAQYINTEWRDIATRSSLKRAPSEINVKSPVLDKVRSFVKVLSKH